MSNIEPSAWIVDYETVTGVSYGQEIKSYWTTKRLHTFDKHQVEYLLGQEALGGDTLHAVRNVEVMPLYSGDHIPDTGKKVCATCKHWVKDFETTPYNCENEEVRSWIDGEPCVGYSFETPPEFGCALWEAK